MKSIKFLLMAMVAIMFTMSSCTKENTIIEEVTPPVVTPGQSSSNPLVNRAVTTNEGLDMGCFSIDYPFSLTVNGDISIIASEEDFINVLESITEPIDSFYVDFVYPLQITYTEDDSMATIEDGEALGEAFATCIPDGGWGNPGFPAFLINDLNSCFTLNYPVSLVDLDGETSTAANEEEFVALVGEFPGLSFVFPISLTSVEDQSVVSVEDEEALFDLLLTCEDNWNPIDTTINPGAGLICYACYHVGYPTSYVNADGETVVANSLDELSEAFMTGDFYDFGLPMTLIDYEENEFVVTTEEELDEAVEDCEGFGNPGGEDADLLLIWIMSQTVEPACYDLVYPITITSDDGVTTSTLADQDALLVELDNDVSSDIVYPLTLLDLTTNEIVTFDSLEGVFEYFSNCQ